MVELKMADNNENRLDMTPTCMKSVNRIVKLPVVEQGIQTASNVYEKVKDLNGYTKWGLETMENTLYSVIENGKPYAIPVVQKLERPIKTVDDALCTGIDYVEEKVPAVKLPAEEMISQLYNTTKEYVSPKVDAAYKSVHSVVDPAVTLAKPTVDAAYKMVEPMVQPAVERAAAMKDYGYQKVEEYLRRESRSEEDEATECKDCKPES